MNFDLKVTKLSHDELVSIISGADSGISYWAASMDVDPDDYAKAKDELTEENFGEGICYEDVIARVLNKGKDIVELDAQKRSTYVAFTVGGLLIIAIAIVEFIVTKRFPFGVIAGLQGMLATAFLVKYITLRKKHELVVIICYSLLFVGFLALWIYQLIKGL